MIPNYYSNVPWFFLIWPILEAWAEILHKNFVCFLGDLKSRKIASEINWPLIQTLIFFQAKKAPVSPLKIKDDGSMYENSTLDTGSTTLHARKNRLGHSTLVSMDHNGSPMTTLLRFVFTRLIYTSHSAYDTTSTKANGVKINGFFYPNFMMIPKK